jgi:hypothetical protein
MNKLTQYFLGDILRNTNDAFERARAILLFRLSFMFMVIFFLPVITDIALGYEKAAVVHIIAFILLILMPFIMKKQHNIEKSVNLLFSICITISGIVFMMLNPTTLDTIGVSWTIFFFILSTLLQRGRIRIFFCCFLLWLPLFYVLANKHLDGALTVEWIQQKGAENPPVFLMFIPILLSIYAVWTNTTTIEEAKRTITEQKQIIDEKNKDIIDSIHYAKRTQNSLLPTEQYLDKNLKRLRKGQ